MISLVILSFFYLFFPLAILWACQRFPLLNKLGAVVIAYVVGLILGNTGLLPNGSEGVQDIFTTVTIPLAIPLLLFSTNVRSWLSLAPVTLKAFLLGLAALMFTLVSGYFIFGTRIPDGWKVAGMLAGVYTGGTPNLVALKAALDVDADTYIVTNAYDIVFSAVHLFILLTVGQRLVGLCLPAFSSTKKEGDEVHAVDSSGLPYWGLNDKKQWKSLSGVLGLSVLIFGAGGGLSLLVPETAATATAILAITSLGIAASFIPRVNRVTRSFDLGMYLILSFSIVVASMADAGKLVHANPGLIFYVLYAVFGTLAIHLLLARWFKVDTDTLIITSTAMVCSPPFVPVVAGALRNREVILSGLTVGIMGYAIGNYLGVMTAYILKFLDLS